MSSFWSFEFWFLASPPPTLFTFRKIKFSVYRSLIFERERARLCFFLWGPIWAMREMEVVLLWAPTRRDNVHTLAQFELGRRDGIGVAVILLQQGGGELKREIEEWDRGTQETREEPEEATTGRVGNNEDGEQQIQAQQDGLINNNIAFSVNAALLLPPALAAPPAVVSTVCTTQKPFIRRL